MAVEVARNVRRCMKTPEGEREVDGTLGHPSFNGEWRCPRGSREAGPWPSAFSIPAWAGFRSTTGSWSASRRRTFVALRRAGCERLFAEGYGRVVLACNMASGIALGRLQRTWLPGCRRKIGRPLQDYGDYAKLIAQFSTLLSHAQGGRGGPQKQTAAR